MSQFSTRRLLTAGLSSALIGLSASCQVGRGPSQAFTPPATPMPSMAPSAMPSMMPSTAPTNPMPSTDPSVTPTAMPTTTPSTPVSVNAYALTDNNELVGFDRANPMSTQSPMQITGLAAEEDLVGIDFRATDRMLYAISNQGRIYSIDVNTGAATAASATPFEGGVNGAEFGVDFNPTVDRLRLHSDQTQNLRLHPDTGERLAIDGTLTYLEGDSAFGTAPMLVGTAYTNPVPNAEATQLYAIDSDDNTLVRLPSPNDGGIVTVGSLGADVSEAAALDITVTGEAFAALQVGGSSGFYRVNLGSGEATLVGTIGDGTMRVTGMALVLDPPAAAVQVNAYALNASNGLLSFVRTNPVDIRNRVQVTGLASGERLIGIDFRATDKMLYGVSNQSKIYSINLTTGAATAASATPFSESVNGSAFGVDFNPTVDRIRVHSNQRQNLRLHPDTGELLAVDGTLTYLEGDSGFDTPPVLVGTAYTNPVPNAQSTALYAIDSDDNNLVMLPSPNEGGVQTVGPLGFDVSDAAALDITVAGDAFAVLQVAGRSAVYSINLSTGQATAVGNVGNGQEQIIGMSLTL